MKYNKLFASIMLALASVSASAADIERIHSIVLDDDNSTFSASFASGNAGKSFLEIFNFTISGSSSLGSSLTSTLKLGHDLDITSFGLYSGTTQLAAGTKNSTGSLESWTLDALMPASGSYSMRVGGTVIGKLNVSFVGDGYVTAVPEPEAWSMLIGGLGLVGFLARRRKSSGAPSDALAA